MKTSHFFSRAITLALLIVSINLGPYACTAQNFGQQIAELLITKDFYNSNFICRNINLSIPEQQETPAQSSIIKPKDASRIEIRQARIDELESIISMDYNISMEFFKPMFEQHYTSTIMGQQAEKLLTDEVKINDRIDFNNAIKSNHEKQKLVIAFDPESSTYCGLILSEQIRDNAIEILLLLVDKDYRGCGIGKKLIKKTLSIFKDTTRCEVYPFQKHNESTLSFYEKVGFKKIGPETSDRKNAYGIARSQLYFEYILDETGIKQLLKK